MDLSFDLYILMSTFFCPKNACALLVTFGWSYSNLFNFLFLNYYFCHFHQKS